MTTYISILRGINVSGKNLIKMETLRKAYENLGFQDVKSYVQSGNVVFNAEAIDPKTLAEKISEMIAQEFGMEVPVIAFEAEKLERVITQSPFTKDSEKDPKFLHVTFLASIPAQVDMTAIEEKKQAGEEITIVNDAVYLYCPNGYGKSKLTNNFLENKLKVSATTRNWKTTNQLLNMAQEITK